MLGLEKKDRYDLFVKFLLIAVAIISLFAAIYMNLTFGRSAINSDSEGAYRFFRSIEKTHSLYPKTWNTGNGEVYLIHPWYFCALFNFLIKDSALATQLGYSAGLFCVCAGFVWLYKKAFKNDAWTIAIPFLICFIKSEDARFLILIYTCSSGTFLIITFCAALFFYAINRRPVSKVALFLHGVLVVLMVGSGIRNIAEYVLPILLALALYIFFFQREYKWEIAMKTGWTLILPTILGRLLYKYLCATHNMNFGDNSSLKLDFSIAAIIESIKDSCHNTCVIFGYNLNNNVYLNALVVIMTIALCVVFPILQLVRIKKSNDNEKGYILYAFMHNWVLLTAIILSHKTQERYIYSTVLVCLALSANYIYHVIFEHKFIIRYVLVFIILFVTLIESNGFYRKTDNWRERLAKQYVISQQLIDAGVTKIYGSYWNVHPIEVYSNGNIKSGTAQILGYSLRNILAQIDNDAYEKRDGRCALLLTEKEYNEQYALHGIDPAERLIGHPQQAFIVEDVGILGLMDGSERLIVYVYDEDIIDNFTDGLDDGVLTPRELEFNYGGVWEKDVIYLTHGGIIHGPYLGIAPGYYKVNYDGSNMSVCEVSVYSQQQEGDISFEVESVSDEKIVLDLEIKHYINDIQFYVMNNTEAKAEFYKIELSPYDKEEE